MMKSLILCLGLLFSSTLLAQQKASTPIYKWVEGGSVKYSYYVPSNVKEYEVISKESRRIPGDSEEDFTDFPTIKTVEKKENSTRAEIKKQNCEISKQNVNALKGGAVFDKKEDGSIYELNNEQKAERLKEAEKGIDYYCS